jgi:PAS domain S-box-containing protein
VSVDDRVLVLGGPSETVAVLAAPESGISAVPDLDGCLARLGEAQEAVSLVVVDLAWPQPLVAAREVRRVDATVGLAVAVRSSDVPAMRAKLAFLPDVADVAVVAADVGPQELRSQLAEVAGSSRRRRRVRGALDAINRDLAGAPAGGAAAPSSSVSEHYLAALVRHAADTIISIDPGGRIVTVNEAGQRTLGLDPARVEGRALRELLAGDDPGDLGRMLSAAAEGEVQVDDGLSVRLREGPQLLLSATAAPVLDDVGALAGLVLIARDVTDERQAEQRLRALQKAESLATLATGVAHDFNNLLVQAQGWADIAAEDPEDAPTVATALEHIGLATRRASELARAMLAYGGRGRFEPEQVRLAWLVSELEPLLRASVPARIRLEVDLAHDPEVHADATQLRQVLLNLVGNAAEAIGDDAGTISIRTATVTVDDDVIVPGGVEALASGPYAVIEVIDDGPGIEPDHRDRLFDPFFTTKFTGRGLGLAASQGIARAHGGAIIVDSCPGRGARFRVHLATM